MQCFEEVNHLLFLQFLAREKWYKFIPGRGLTSIAVMAESASLHISLVCIKEKGKVWCVNKFPWDVSTIFRIDVWVSIREQHWEKIKKVVNVESRCISGKPWPFFCLGLPLGILALQLQKSYLHTACLSCSHYNTHLASRLLCFSARYIHILTYMHTK